MSVYDVAAVDRLNRLGKETKKPGKDGSPGAGAGPSPEQSPRTGIRRTKSYHSEQGMQRNMGRSMPATPGTTRRADRLRQSMDKHKASLSRPDSPQNSNSSPRAYRRQPDDETRSLYDEGYRRYKDTEDTRSLHSDDIRRLRQEDEDRAYNDDIPRLRYKQRIHNPDHYRQASLLNLNESAGRIRREPSSSGYRTVSSSRPRSSIMEGNRSQAFDETKKSLRNSQVFLDDIDFDSRLRHHIPTSKGHSFAPRHQDEFFDLDAHRYPRLSNNYTTLPSNMRLQPHERRQYESLRESAENLDAEEVDDYRAPPDSRGSRYDPYDESGYWSDSRRAPQQRGPSRRLNPSHYDQDESHYYSDTGGTRNRYMGRYDEQSRREMDFQERGNIFYPPNYSASQTVSPNRQNYQTKTNRSSPASSSRSSRAGSPISISRRSSRQASPAQRGKERPQNLPVNPDFDRHEPHLRPDYAPSGSRTSSARSSRATSPSSSYCSSRQRVHRSKWMDESHPVQGQHPSQNISNQIQEFLVSSGNEASADQPGGPAIIYVRETFKILNPGDQNFPQITPKPETSGINFQSPDRFSNFATPMESPGVSPFQTNSRADLLGDNKASTSTPLKSPTPSFEEPLSVMNTDSPFTTQKTYYQREKEQSEDDSYVSDKEFYRKSEVKEPSYDKLPPPIEVKLSTVNVKPTWSCDDDEKDEMEEKESVTSNNNDISDNDISNSDTIVTSNELKDGNVSKEQSVETTECECSAILPEDLNVSAISVEDDRRSVGTQDSSTATLDSSKITIHLSSGDVDTSQIATSDRSSLERLLDSLSHRIQQIEAQNREQIADIGDLDDSARAESVTSILSSTSSKDRPGEERQGDVMETSEGGIEVHSTIRRQSVIIEGLTMETDELRRKCIELQDELQAKSGTATPMVDDLTSKLQQVEAKLEESESYCYQVIEENVELKSEMEELEAEINEVQDTFRDKDAKEFKKVKWELENLSKTCRNLQIKLGKAQAKATRLRQEKEEIEDKQREQMLWKTTAVVAMVGLASYQILRQFK